MRKIVAFLLIAMVAYSCNSVERYNKQLSKQHSEKDLKKDVDYVYRKLNKLHPSLDWYISKEALAFKFDSLKATIKSSMTSNEFYFKISPVVASVRQGHMQMQPLVKRMKKKQLAVITKKGAGPLSQFDYKAYNGKLYIIRNKSKDSTIKVGSEVIMVNNTKPQDLFRKYEKTYTSDGFNQTYITNTLGQYFASFYFYENGISDSLLYKVKYKDSIKEVWVRRATLNEIEKKDTIKRTKLELQKLKRKEMEKKFYLGYNKTTKKYSKSLTFPTKDSSVAVMKISDFALGAYHSFYKDSFKKMDSLKTKTLIIDLRGNPGGKIKEIANLYSYLVDTSFVLINKSEVASRTSILNTKFFKGKPLLLDLFIAVFYPPIVISRFAKVEKDKDGRYYYKNKESRLAQCRKSNFKGKIYVIIDGGCFSASCLLSTNLKGSKRATFVGEETGGAYNGCVAGMMPLFALPHSKLPIRIGLMAIKPFYKSTIEGRGVFPDVEIIPTLDDKIQDKDPEMDWVLKDLNLHKY